MSMRTAELVTTDRSPSNHDQLLSQLQRIRGFDLQNYRTHHHVIWREPGNQIKNYDALERDHAVLAKSHDGVEVQVNRAEPRCLYLTVKGAVEASRLTIIEQLFSRHYQPAAA